MKKLLLALILVTLGTAFTQSRLTFAFDDKDFLYSGREAGYLSLTLEGDELVVHLSDKPTDTMLRLDETRAPERMDTNGDGRSRTTRPFPSAVHKSASPWLNSPTVT